MGAPPEDRYAELRAQMRAKGLRVGPDGPVAPPGGPVAAAVRRAFDVVAAALALVAVGPALALVAWLIRRGSPGPALFRQVRVGRDGREFTLLKLRTMVHGAERIGPGLAIDRADSRITPLGRLLRRTSVDELPQLVNVLRGDMSIVGPRPTVPFQVARYDARQRERLLVKPGITGWAQIHGRTSLTWPERIEMDRFYVANQSLRLDAVILRRTFRVVVGGQGVERDGRAWIEPV